MYVGLIEIATNGIRIWRAIWTTYMAGIADIQNANEHYSLWGLNPRPMAHKTIALATELRELELLRRFIALAFSIEL